MEFYTTFLIFAALFVVCAIGQEGQRVVLYDQFEGDGEYLVISENYIPDLSRYNNFAVHSVCLTGIWIFYQHPNYNPDGIGGVEYMFGRVNYCVNLKTLAGFVGSLRYAGNPKDYRTDTLTLYEFDYFQGREEFTQNELPDLSNLRDAHGSIIITGNNDWTVFDASSYQGEKVCLRVPDPGSSTPAFLSDLAELDPNIPYGSIRSVRRGCTSGQEGRNVTMISFGREERSFQPVKVV